MYGSLQKKCIYCGETIPVETGRCPFCGSILRQGPDGDYAAETGEKSENNINRDAEAGQGTGNEAGPAAGADEAENRTHAWEPGMRHEYGCGPRQPYGGNRLGNGMKVFLTLLFALLPGIGQLAGIITGIVFMSSEDDGDKKSFGVALLIANIVLFMLSCIGCFVFSIVTQSMLM